MSDANDNLLTLAQAAKLLSYEPGGLRKIVTRTAKGKPGPQIQFFQIGRGPIKFKREWLDDFVLANSVVPWQAMPRKQEQRKTRRSLNDNQFASSYQWGTKA